MRSSKYDVNEIWDEFNQQNNDCLTSESFYPPSDNRYLKSYVKDIYGGDNFADYCQYIFKVLEEEGYYD